MENNFSRGFVSSVNTSVNLGDVPKNLLEKFNNIESSRITATLIEISQKPIFMFHPELFDLILTQSNPQSQIILFGALDSNLISNKVCINELMYYTDNPEKQQRIVLYSQIPNIFYEEFFLISMLGIEDEFVEAKMRECFKKGVINNTHDFISYKNSFEARSNFNKNIIKLGKKKR